MTPVLSQTYASANTRQAAGVRLETPGRQLAGELEIAGEIEGELRSSPGAGHLEGRRLTRIGPSVPFGDFAGSPEDTLDCACGTYSGTPPGESPLGAVVYLRPP